MDDASLNDADADLQSMAASVVGLNEQISALNKEVRELRKEKRARAAELLDYMVQHNVPEVHVGTRKILLDQNLTFA
jgi:hypothetical protein